MGKNQAAGAVLSSKTPAENEARHWKKRDSRANFVESEGPKTGKVEREFSKSIEAGKEKGEAVLAHVRTGKILAENCERPIDVKRGRIA